MASRTTQTLMERASHDIGVAAQDVGTADVTGDWFAMADFRRVMAVAVSEAVTENDTLTVQLRQAKDDSGDEAKDLGDAVTVTAGGAEPLIAMAEARVEEMDADFTHVAVQLSASDDGTDAAAVLIRGDGRFRGGT